MKYAIGARARSGKLRACLASIGIALLLSSCHQSEQLPGGAKVILSPTDRSIEIQEFTDENGFCLYDENFYQDTPLLITVTNDEGTPIGKTEVSVYVDYSGNTFSGINALSLYADYNSNGVVDHPEELVSGAEDGIYRGETGTFDGELFLLLRMNLSCAFRGQVYAFAGSASGSMTVEVSSQD